MAHFEDLWEQAEELLRAETSVSSWEDLTQEALAKFHVLAQIKEETFSASTPEELIQLRANVLGKLLLVLSQLSAKNGINVYAALNQAVENRKISVFENRYKTNG